MRSLSLVARLARALVLTASLGALSGCGQTQADRGPAGSSAGAPGGESASSTVEEIGFVVVGDSLTAGTDPIEGNRVVSAQSWVPAAEGPPLAFLGGWAVPGATTAGMLEEVGPMRADVLVLMAGTNDLLGGYETPGIHANLVAIVERVGVDEVLLAAIGPIDGRAAEVTEYNRQLEALAAESGWRFVDPWVDAWDDGSFVRGASDDGLHPVPEHADRVGRQIRTALLEASAD